MPKTDTVETTNLIYRLEMLQRQNLWTDDQLAEQFLGVKRSTWAMARNKHTRLGAKVLGRIAKARPELHAAVVQYLIETADMAEERDERAAA